MTKMHPPKVAFDKRWKENDDGCWIWTGSVFNHGYGLFSNKYGREKSWVTTASRASWIIHNGEIPDGLFVCHKCDVPLCVNPEHLFLGTSKENTHDAIEKGRFQSSSNPCYQKGSDRRRAILNEDIVRQARKRVSQGDDVGAIAAEIGVQRQTLRHAVVGYTWKHVA